MEVTHHETADTHATVGGIKQASFGIADTPEMYTMLSQTLYSRPLEAVVREIICNSWDAHKMIGVTDRPIEIELTDTHMSFRDYGPGIPADMMIDIYCVYGASTKVKQANQTGGFGLGSKAPFAYSDHFMATTFNAGLKTVYAFSKNGIENDGKPTPRLMAQAPTTETGVLVRIPFKSKEDRKTFEDLIRNFLLWGEVKATVNGEEIVQILLNNPPNKVWVIQGQSPIDQTLGVRLGGVLYPVSPTLTELYDLMPTSRRNFTMILDMPPNSVTVAPNRENLSVNKRTTDAIREALENFKKVYNHAYTPQEDFVADVRERNLYNARSTARLRQLLKQLPADVILTRLSNNIPIEDWVKVSSSKQVTRIYSSLRAIRSSLSSRYLDDAGAFLPWKLPSTRDICAKWLFDYLGGPQRGKRYKLWKRFKKYGLKDQAVIGHDVSTLMYEKQDISVIGENRETYSFDNLAIPMSLRRVLLATSTVYITSRMSSYASSSNMRREAAVAQPKQVVTTCAFTRKTTDRREWVKRNVPTLATVFDVAEEQHQKHLHMMREERAAKKAAGLLAPTIKRDGMVSLSSYSAYGASAFTRTEGRITEYGYVVSSSVTIEYPLLMRSLKTEEFKSLLSRIVVARDDRQLRSIEKRGVTNLFTYLYGEWDTFLKRKDCATVYDWLFPIEGVAVGNATITNVRNLSVASAKFRKYFGIKIPKYTPMEELLCRTFYQKENALYRNKAHNLYRQFPYDCIPYTNPLSSSFGSQLPKELVGDVVNLLIKLNPKE